MTQLARAHAWFRLCAWAILIVGAWQLLPDRYMGPFDAWNPHAVMEFVVTIFSISVAGKLAVRWLGAHDGLLLTGLIGGFASSTATIHAMGRLAKLTPSMASRAALGGVLSNSATLVQLVILLRLLMPDVLTLLVQPLLFGMVGMLAYAAWVMTRKPASDATSVQPDASVVVDWKGLFTLTALVCSVSFAAAALNAELGQKGMWFGAALSGLVDAHAIVPSLASLTSQGQFVPQDAVMPLLIALSANTFTKSVLALHSGGWAYARQVALGVWIMTAAVWLGFWCSRSGDALVLF